MNFFFLCISFVSLIAFFYFCCMIKTPIVLNQDRLLRDIHFEAEFNNCGWRTLAIKKHFGFEAQGGSVFVQTRVGWRSLYGFHFWNIGVNGEVIDSYEAFHKGVAEEKRLCELHGGKRQLKNFTSFKYKLFDSVNAKSLKYSDRFNFRKGITMDYYDSPCPVEKWLNKHIPKNRYELLYVKDIAYDDYGRLFTPNALKLLHTKFADTDLTYNLDQLIQIAG